MPLHRPEPCPPATGGEPPRQPGGAVFAAGAEPAPPCPARCPRRALLVAALPLACGAAARAQARPERTLRLWVGFAAGGSADQAARLLGERLAAEIGHAVVVENKPGAGGRIAAELLKSAPADGFTLMLAPVVVPVLAPLVFRKLGYQPEQDFAPVALVARYAFALSVHAEHPARTLAELLAHYRAHPEQANFGSPASGSLPHFFGVMVARAAGVELVHVPFNGGAPLMNALAGGQVSAAIDTLVDEVEMHRAGRTRVLAVSGAQRSALLPEVPTFAEAGLPGAEGTAWFGLYAPARTPAARIEQINAAVNRALAGPKLREAYLRLGLDPLGGSPADLAAAMNLDRARWAPAVRASGFQGD